MIVPALALVPDEINPALSSSCIHVCKRYIHSFKVCGIFIKMNGSEVSLVHCIKHAGGMAADAAAAISAETATLLRDVDGH